MIPSAGDELAVKWEGLVVAGVAFVATRGLLVSTLVQPMSTGITRALSGLLPLVLGLLVTLYGVDLAVSTRTRQYVRTTTAWFLLGTGGMFLVVAVPALGATDPAGYVLSNEAIGAAVVGGGLGGLLVGTRTATTNAQRGLLERQAEQAVLVNRLLRHEVLNAMTAIRGHAGLLHEGRGTENSWGVVETSADRITRTIEDVGYIVRTGGDTAAALGTVSLPDVVRAACDRLPDPDAVEVSALPDVAIRADDHLATAIEELLRAAVERSDATPVLEVETTPERAVVTVTAPGATLSDNELLALTEHLPEYDSPDVGYGFSIVNLLVGQYDGDVTAETTDSETVVSLHLPRTSADARLREDPGLSRQAFRQATVAGLVAGVAMGLLMQALSGSIAIIGALYGSATPTVAWLTHLFHSLVFSTAFAAMVAHPRVAPNASTILRTTGLAVVWGVVLWLVAGGIVMSAWLNLVGIPAPIPNLTPVPLAGHVVWGLLLGLVLWLHPDEA